MDHIKFVAYMAISYMTVLFYSVLCYIYIRLYVLYTFV
jgi:hypothetical protein